MFSWTSGPKVVFWAEAERGRTGSSELDRGEVGVDQARACFCCIYNQWKKRERRMENMEEGMGVVV